MTKTKLAVLLIMVAAAVNIFTGIWCGLPSEERLKVELGGRAYLESQRETWAKMLNSTYAVRQENEMNHDDTRAMLSPFADMVRTYHSDEQFTLKTISRMVSARDWEPHLYTYGQFYHYLTAVAPAVSALTGILPMSLSQEKLIMEPELGRRLFLSCRILHGLFALAGVAVLGLAVYRLTGRKDTALIAMALLAACPLYSLWAKIIKPDIIMCFFLTASFYFAAGLRQGDKWKDYIGLGICFGLATGCKYVAPLYGIIPLGFIICRKSGFKQSFRRLLASGGIALLVFTLFNFSWLTDWKIFWQDVLGTSALVTSQKFLLLRIAEYLAAFVFDGLFFHTGIIGTALTVWVMTFGVKIFDNTWRTVWLGGWAFVLLAGSAVLPQSDQYLLPAVPLAAALLAVWLTSFHREKLRCVILTLLLLSSAWYSAALDIHAAVENQRLTAAKRLTEILPANSVISRGAYPVSYRTVMLPPGRYRSVINDGNADYTIECSYQFSRNVPHLFNRWIWLTGTGKEASAIYHNPNTPFTAARLIKSPRLFTMNSALEMVMPYFVVGGTAKSPDRKLR